MSMWPQSHLGRGRSHSWSVGRADWIVGRQGWARCCHRTYQSVGSLLYCHYGSEKQQRVMWFILTERSQQGNQHTCTMNKDSLIGLGLFYLVWTLFFPYEGRCLSYCKRCHLFSWLPVCFADSNSLLLPYITSLAHIFFLFLRQIAVSLSFFQMTITWSVWKCKLSPGVLALIAFPVPPLPVWVPADSALSVSPGIKDHPCIYFSILTGQSGWGTSNLSFTKWAGWGEKSL